MDEPKSKFWQGFDNTFSSGGLMKDRPEVHGLSICSVMLEMYFGDQRLATGTGWFWRLAKGIALVTAWHNLSGLHHTTRKPISSNGGMPDRIRYRYMTRLPQIFQDVEIPLYLDEDRTRPRWFVHPTCGSYFDMAYLGLEIQGAEVACVNDSISTKQTPRRPGSDVFAVGYPQGVRMAGVFPVWKRGSIASDPDLPVEGLPKFFVDMAGRGGLSGAPIYRIQQGLVVNETATGQSIGIGNQTEFLGLYSGRAADQLPPDTRSGESTELGFVWHAKFIEEMLRNGVLDECPEVGKGVNTVTEIWQKRRG